MARIDEIIVDTFRGASKPLSLIFSPKKTLAVIFGENGTGKTTIVDAIDVVANQNVGSIRDRSSTSAGKHAHTIGTNQAAISIALKSDNRDWTATNERRSVYSVSRLAATCASSSESQPAAFHRRQARRSLHRTQISHRRGSSGKIGTGTQRSCIRCER